MSKTYRMSFEVERGDRTVEYQAEFSVLPGDPGSGPSFASAGGEPSYPPEVEAVRVFYVHKDQKTGKMLREERPEMEPLVDEAELLEYSFEQDDDGYEDALDRKGEARREDRLLGED
jgi:hypothetical protein